MIFFGFQVGEDDVFEVAHKVFLSNCTVKVKNMPPNSLVVNRGYTYKTHYLPFKLNSWNDKFRWSVSSMAFAILDFTGLSQEKQKYARTSLHDDSI